MAADDIVNINIVLKSKATSAAGFGRALFLAFHTHWLARTKLYTASSWDTDMLTDGFLVTDKVYQDMQAYFSQKPAPKDAKIGRRALAPTQVVNLIPTITTTGFVYSGVVDGVAWTYTVIAAATIATISTALATLFSALGVGITASGASTTWCACTSNVAGKIHEFTNMVPELHVADVTTDPGIATDLAAIKAADNDWFGVCLDSQSKAEVLAAAAYLETQRKVFFYATADYSVKDPASTTDVMYTAKANAYFNTMGLYHHEVASQLAAGAMGVWLVAQVGPTTLAHQEVLAVVASDTAPNGSRWLSDSESVAVQNKNGNIYVTLGSQGDLFPTKVSGGDFVDNVRNIHFMHARLQEMYITALQQKGGGFRQTNKGIAKVGLLCLNQLNAWTRSPFFMLDDDPQFAPTVTTLTIDQLSTADKAAQHLPGTQFTARVQGAIILIDLNGSVTV